MTAYIGGSKIKDTGAYGVYLGSQNTNCLTYTPKNVNLELSPLNVTIIGSPTINNGVVSGLSASNYLRVPSAFNHNNKSWEMVWKLTTGSNVSTSGQFVSSNSNYGITLTVESSRFTLNLSSNGSSFNIANTRGTYTVLANTNYWVKVEFNGTSYKLSYSLDGKTYNTDISITSSATLYNNTTLNIGIGRLISYPFLGSIDLSGCYIKINGSTWWKGGTGALTLKTGSKGYMGNGAVRTISGNLTLNNYSAAQMFLHITSGGTGLYAGYMTGGTVSERPASPVNYASYYNTSTQKCEYYNGSSWVEVSLPIAIVTRGGVSGEGFKSIDQIFDWCGYIGSTVFVLPGVKGLIPNGFNADGTYKVIEFETSKVAISTFTISTYTGNYIGYMDANGVIAYQANNYYDKSTNTMTNNYQNRVQVLSGYLTAGVNTSLTPYTAQPAMTAIPINAIYNGSQLVYQYIPYNIGQVLLYGANTGAKTYTLPKGQYQCCVVGGGWSNQSNWSLASGAAAEIVFKLTAPATVEVYSGPLGATGYLNINGARIVTANTASGEMVGGTYSINTSSPYHVRTVMASNGNNANMSVGASVSPYENWGGGHDAGGARLAFVGR